jgi:hypothetical protein
MEAKVGDEIVIDGHKAGEVSRTGKIIEVVAHGEVVHYRVQWTDGHETTLFPSSDAHVVRSGARSS